MVCLPRFYEESRRSSLKPLDSSAPNDRVTVFLCSRKDNS